MTTQQPENVRIDLHVHLHGLESPKLDQILSGITDLLKGQASMAQDLTEVNTKLDTVISDLTEETTQIGNLSVFIQGLKDAIANQGFPPEVVAKIDNVFAAVEQRKGAIANAMNAGLTVSPTSPPPPATRPSNPTSPYGG